jgi:ribosomal protein S20
VVAVLDATQSAEARASINMPVVEKNYHYDKFGSMQRKFSQAISAGDREAAASAMKEYENDLDEARDTFGAPLVSEGNERLLSAMKSELGQAFSGPQARQKEQQNRLGKKYWKESLLHQRQQK